MSSETPTTTTESSNNNEATTQPTKEEIVKEDVKVENQPEEKKEEEKKEETKEESVQQQAAAVEEGSATTTKKPQQQQESSSSSDEDDWKSSFWRGGFFRRREEPEPNVQELWSKEDKLTVEERRKRYHCRRFVKAADLPTWDQYSKDLKVNWDSIKSEYQVDPVINSKIALWHGDITSIEADCIVNAANESCLGGGGVDGAIHSAAGNMLYQECRTLHGCRTGDAKITRGYDLPAKFVLHAVGPIGEDPVALTSCYKRCMELAAQHNLKTIVFCGISTGIFGYPLTKASKIALKTVRQWMETDNNKDKVDKVIFCTFLGKEQVCYDQLTPYYFPTQQSQPAETTAAEPKKD